MRSRILFLLLAALPAALAQNPTPGDMMPVYFPDFPQLTKYLELTPDQTQALGRATVEWRGYLAIKALRVAAVQDEIRQLTDATSVDASALGVRYAELEAICREARDTDAKTQATLRKSLTDAQRAKLAALEQAYALLPVIAEADAALLMNAPLPGLQMAAAATRAYPGCRPFAPASVVLPIQLMPGPR
jgi:Spy/CpxP family protein refolding chaperone